MSDHDFSDTEEELRELLLFLSQTYQLNGWLHNWSSIRLADWFYGGNSMNRRTDPDYYRKNLHLWRKNGEVIGFCVSEYPDAVSMPSVFFQVHPGHRELEPLMLDWAMDTWGKGRARMAIPTYNIDAPRQNVLKDQGFQDNGACGMVRKYDVHLSARPCSLPSGFRFASMAEQESPESFITAVRAAFRRDVLGREWYDNKVQAPGYDPAWNVCVLDAAGQVVSFADARIDHVGGYSEIDPIGTLPQFQRQGLARCCVLECFRRLREAGVRYAHIGSAPDPNPSNRLYESLRPVARYEERSWEKELRP